MKKLFKFLFLLIALALVGCATTGTVSSDEVKSISVRVTGVGPTFESAQQNGFRNAIQQVYGSLILSERRILNDVLTEQDVSYSGGMVEKYSVINYYINSRDRQFVVDLIVSVSSAAIQKRLIYSTDSTLVKGSQLMTAVLNARAQAKSEIERFEKAKQLFLFYTKNITKALIDLKTEKVETLKNGSNITTTVFVVVYTNRNVLNDLCKIGNELQAARSAVPEKSMRDRKRRETNLMIVHDPGSCLGEIDVEENFLKNIINDIKAHGICLTTVDGQKRIIKNNFFRNFSFLFETDRSHLKGISDSVFSSGFGYYYQEGGGTRFARDGLLLTTRKNRISFVIGTEGYSLPLSGFSDSELSRISEIQARATTEGECKMN